MIQVFFPGCRIQRNSSKRSPSFRPQCSSVDPGDFLHQTIRLSRRHSVLSRCFCACYINRSPFFFPIHEEELKSRSHRSDRTGYRLFIPSVRHWHLTLSGRLPCGHRACPSRTLHRRYSITITISTSAAILLLRRASPDSQPSSQHNRRSNHRSAQH